MTEARTIAVLGPGAVGGALTVPLVLHGARVICVGHSATVEAIARDGLTLVRRDDEFHARPEATDVLRDPVDVLVITVKAPALSDALGRVDAPAVTVLPLLNGLEHMELIRARLEGNVVAGTIGLLEAFRESPTRIVQTTSGPAITAAEPLSLPGFEVRVAPEAVLLWDKVVRMAPLAAATALSQRPVGELRSDPAWRSRLELAIAETCEVANAHGVDLEPSGQWEIIDRMAEKLTTSTARDVAAGRPSELDAITGAVVRAGRRVGIPTPVLAELWEEACQAQSR